MDALPDGGLPRGWAVATIGDLIEGIEAGKNVAAIGRPPENGETGIVKVSAVTWGEFDEDESKALLPGTKVDPAHLIKPGDFLISRANTIELVGAPVIVKQFRRRLVLSDKVLRLRVVEGFDRWLELFLKSHFGRAQIEQYATGAQLSMRNISQENLRRITVPIAPLAEQARIVAAVNAVFEEVEAGEAALARARESLTQFRASLLHAAFSGELTAEWRAAHAPNESGADLVTRIVFERRARGWQGAIPEASEPFQVPAAWAWSSIGALFDVFVGATPSRRNHVYWGGNVPWISSGEVAFCTIKSTRETITSAGLANSSTRLHPPGTVLLAMIGEGRTRGQAAILGIAACNNQNSAAIHVADTPIPPQFVYHWLAFMYEETRRAGAGGNQPALNKERVRAIAVPIPPVPEMAEIVSRLDELLQDAAIATVAEEGARLRQSILHAAFTGRLVPQNPDDEPAAALLDRLRASPAAPRAPRKRRTAAQPDLIETAP